MRFNTLSQQTTNTNTNKHTNTNPPKHTNTNKSKHTHTYYPPNEYIGMQLNDMEYTHDLHNHSDYVFEYDDINLKFILLGDAHTGKSTFVRRIENKHNLTLSSTYIATIGVDMSKIKLINTKLNKQVGVQLWDTAGQERFRSIISSYYKDTCVALLFFDINNYETFQNAKNHWYEEIKQNAPDTMIFLIGNKYDERNPNRCVLDEEIHSFVIKNKLFYIENENRSREMAKINLKAIISEVLKRKDLHNLTQGITYPKTQYKSGNSQQLTLTPTSGDAYNAHDNCCIIS